MTLASLGIQPTVLPCSGAQSVTPPDCRAWPGISSDSKALPATLSEHRVQPVAPTDGEPSSDGGTLSDTSLYQERLPTPATLHFKELKKQHTKPIVSRREELIKAGTERNELE